MLLQIHGFEIKNLQKAGDTVTVDIIANHLTEDSDNETILKTAFDDDTVKSFLDYGVIDFWHDSKNDDLTKEAKNAAVIGKPIAFNWVDGKPVVTAKLTKGHPRVAEMLPHLEANQPVYAASVGGSKYVYKTTDPDGKEHRLIPKIKWDHLAIAPANSVKNRSAGLNVRLLQKANDIMCEFDNLDSFKINNGVLEKEEALRKALEAPSSASDLYDTPGGAITKQSLEGKVPKLTLSDQDGLDLIDTILKIKNKKIPMRQGSFKDDYMKYFKKRKKEDFGRKSFGLIDKYFKLKKGAK